MLGSVAALLTVEAGHEAAVAAALGAVADAVAVGSTDDAVRGPRALKADDGGRAGLLVGGAAVRPRRPAAARAAGRRRWALDVVASPGRSCAAASTRRSSGVASWPTSTPPRGLVAEAPRPSARSPRDGDVLGARWSSGGSASAPSRDRDQRGGRRGAAEGRRGRRAARAACTRELAEARAERASALQRRRRGGARRAARVRRQAVGRRRAARRARPGGPLGRCRGGPAGRGPGRRPSRPATVTWPALAELEERLQLAEAASDEPAEPDTSERDALQAEVAEARQAEMEARLAVRTGEERVRAVARPRRPADARRRGRARPRAASSRRPARPARTRRRRSRPRCVTRPAGCSSRIGESVAAAAAERDAVQRGRGSCARGS